MLEFQLINCGKCVFGTINNRRYIAMTSQLSDVSHDVVYVTDNISLFLGIPQTQLDIHGDSHHHEFP